MPQSAIALILLTIFAISGCTAVNPPGNAPDVSPAEEDDKERGTDGGGGGGY